MLNPFFLGTDLSKNLPPLSAKNQEILKETTIDVDHPGTILADWQTMLDLIGENGIEVSSKQCYFSIKMLAEINQKLTHPILIDLKRPVQKSYPYIHGLYLLLRASGITKVIHQGSKTKLVVNTDLLKDWQKLNTTEKYFILLEIWLFWSSEINSLDNYSHFHVPYLLALQRLWQMIPDKGVKITVKNESVYNLNRSEEMINVAMLNLFGIIDLQQGKPQVGKGWRLTYLAKTPLGEALINLLNRAVINDDSLLTKEDTEDVIYGNLQPVFQDWFPEFKQQLIIKSLDNQEGIFVFKVSLEKAWRRISIPWDLTLEFLAEAILEAFDFDNDHLYRFICHGSFGKPLEINHPYVEEPPYTTEFIVGKLPLEVGEKMIFHFDFGDDWEFMMLLEAINPPDSQQKDAKIIASYGSAPPQDGYYNDDDDDE
jgi:Plasmid pRiA4b ORF-3-like protein